MTLSTLDSFELLFDLDPRLHGYQVAAVEHLHRNPQSALLLDMGLGKTCTVLQALTPDHLPALVVAPKRVAEQVWPVEGPKWRPDLRVQLVAGAANRRAAALQNVADIYVIGKDNLGDLLGRDHPPFRTVVLDELSVFKGRGVRWRQAKKVCAGAKYVWGLTGTPAPNGLLDLWPQLALLDGGQRLGRTVTGYRERYFTPTRYVAGGKPVAWEPKPHAEQRITELISDICLSMRAVDHLDLPPVTYNDVLVPLPPKVMRDYERTLKTLVYDGEHSAANAAVLTGKLSQITAGFLYADADGDGEMLRLHDAKVQALQEVIDGTGSSVLVFYRFKEELRTLRGFPGSWTLDQPGVIDAWNAGDVPVLLAHPASAGHGLNLQHGGHTIVWATPTWSSEQYQQGNARVARQGQQNPVVVHHLVCPDTIDRRILDVVQGKRTVEEALMEALKR